MLMQIDLLLFRSDCEHIKDVIKPFDWTYTTDYKGSLFGTNETQLKVTKKNKYVIIITNFCVQYCLLAFMLSDSCFIVSLTQPTVMEINCFKLNQLRSQFNVK